MTNEMQPGEVAKNGKVEMDDKEKIRKLEAQVSQLKNIITKLTGQEGSNDSTSKKSRRGGRPFDPNLYKKRHVLLQVAYFGWNYCGFAVQEITGKTIESELFRALKTTRLIENRESSNYHRCGRTDKGVSAFKQVISINLRTNLLEGPGVFSYEGCIAEERFKQDPPLIGPEQKIEEIDYCKILNSTLPRDIQVVAWAPCLQENYSARFDCIQRSYKYFFPRGNINLDRMREGGQHLVGCHDYRNFCKMDIGNGVVNYIRSISAVDVQVCKSSDSESLSESPYDMCELVITGKAYLWHQIRCIVAILFRVGSGLEDPEVIAQLLDVEANPRRPQYVLASEIPLNLFDSKYEEVDSEGNLKVGDWHYDMASLEALITDFQELWTEHSVKATMVRAALNNLERIYEGQGGEPVITQPAILASMSHKKKGYIPLLQMLKCPSLEEKLESSVGKRRRLDN